MFSDCRELSLNVCHGACFPQFVAYVDEEGANPQEGQRKEEEDNGAGRWVLYCTIAGRANDADTDENADDRSKP